jgi:hypothetical protein
MTSPSRVLKEARPDFGAGKTEVFSGKNNVLSVFKKTRPEWREEN